MKAGDLKHRIKIQRLVDGVQNPNTGFVPQNWVDLAEVFASVVPLSAREFIQSAATQALTTTRITIRHRDVTAKDRILHRGKIYNINGVLPDNKSGLEYITLACSEGVNDGSG